jgi:hypothetical protein
MVKTLVSAFIVFCFGYGCILAVHNEFQQAFFFLAAGFAAGVILAVKNSVTFRNCEFYIMGDAAKNLPQAENILEKVAENEKNIKEK